MLEVLVLVWYYYYLHLGRHAAGYVRAPGAPQKSLDGWKALRRYLRHTSAVRAENSFRLSRE